MRELKGVLKQTGILSNLLILIGTAFFFTVLGLLFWQVLTGGNITEIGSLKWMQLFQSIGMFVIPPIVLAYFWSDNPLSFLYLEKKMSWLNAGYIVFFMLMLIPFVNLLGDLNQRLVLPKAFAVLENWMKLAEEQTAQFTDKLLIVHNIQGLFFNVFLIALIPALGEELFFRGALQRILQDWKGPWMAIWITAFIFSAIHLQFYGFLPRLLLGAFFGYLLVWSGNLWIPIFAHFTNNAVAVIFYYLKNNGFHTINIDTIGTGNTLWLGCLSGGLGVVGIFWLKKRLENFESV